MDMQFVRDKNPYCDSSAVLAELHVSETLILSIYLPSIYQACQEAICSIKLCWKCSVQRYTKTNFQQIWLLAVAVIETSDLGILSIKSTLVNKKSEKKVLVK